MMFFVNIVNSNFFKSFVTDLGEKEAQMCALRHYHFTIFPISIKIRLLPKSDGPVAHISLRFIWPNNLAQDILWRLVSRSILGADCGGGHVLLLEKEDLKIEFQERGEDLCIDKLW